MLLHIFLSVENLEHLSTLVCGHEVKNAALIFSVAREDEREFFVGNVMYEIVLVGVAEYFSEVFVAVDQFGFECALEQGAGAAVFVVEIISVAALEFL